MSDVGQLMLPHGVTGCTPENTFLQISTASNHEFGFMLWNYISLSIFSFSALNVNLKEYKENLSKESLGSGVELDLQRTRYIDVVSICYTLDLLCFCSSGGFLLSSDLFMHSGTATADE